MCIGTHSTFWNSVQVIKCPCSLFYVQNLIKNSLIYLLILDVLPIYFPPCFVFRIHMCLVREGYLLHF